MIRLRPAALFAAVTLTAAVQACPICQGLGQQKPCFAEQIIAADSLVIARATNRRTFKVEKILRGDDAALGLPVEPPKAIFGTRILVAYRGKEETLLESVSPDLQGFVETVLSLKTFEPSVNSGWSKQLNVFLPYLGNRDLRVARSAWTAWAHAPYEVVRVQTLLPDPDLLQKWLADPDRASEAALYWRLLGLQADDAIRSQLREKVMVNWNTNDARDLAALLDAELSANGKNAVKFIRERYLDDRTRTLAEIQSALLALRLQGMKGDPSMRKPVALAFENFVINRRPLAGLVASDLATWDRWNSGRTYSEIINSGEPVLPKSRPAILNYLKQCPEIDVKK